MYNVAHYLDKCINSVLDQNLDEEIFEVIMVNDESPDNSLEVAERLAGKHNFITIISQKNKGLGGARNTGILNAKGKYLIFLDADDWLIPSSLNRIIDLADKNSLEILEFGANLISENGDVLSTKSNTSDESIYNGFDYSENIKYMGSACNKLYLKDFLIKNNLFFLEKIYGEDFEFNTRVLYNTKAIMATDIIGAEFLQSLNSITRNKDQSKKDKYLNDYQKILKNIKKYAVEVPDHDDPKIKKFFIKRLATVNINAFYFMFKNGYSYNKIKEYRKELKKEKLLYTKTSVPHKLKNLFRIYILNYPVVLVPLLTLKRIFK